MSTRVTNETGCRLAARWARQTPTLKSQLRIMRSIRTVIAGALALAVCAAARAQRPDVPSTGTFVDRTGAQHTWSVTASHALLWDKQTYVPVGGTFSPRYLAIGQTDEN